MAQVATNPTLPMTPAFLRDEIASTALAFRGYNVTNLGRTLEILEHPVYGPTVTRFLQQASDCCSDVKGRHVDLISRVRQQRETSLRTYDEAISLIVAVESAHVHILQEHFGVDIQRAQVAFGFSLGEIATLVTAGYLRLEDAIRIPLAMSDDCVDLAHDVTLGVLFSRRGQLSPDAVNRLCQEINLAGKGVIGISAYLAPNSLLVIGQGSTLDMLAKRKTELSTERVFLRRNEHRWPPLHTPLVWQRAIPNRAQNLMHTMRVDDSPGKLPVLSLVTGQVSYNDQNVRETIGRWIDQPQQLWSAVEYTLREGVEVVLHIGPQPNIIPATFSRLATNVASQTKQSVGMRALSGIVKRPWLQSLLPKRASLLRAPQLLHVTLEDWLLEVEIPA